MRGKEMLEAVGYADPALIEKGETKAKKNRWKQWTAIAACICLVISGVVVYQNRLPRYATETISPSDWSVGMGFEGYDVYDISELRRDNPSDGAKIKALNVYRNTISYDERMYPYGQDLEAMRAYLLSLCEKFGLDVASLEIFDNAPKENEMQGLIMEFSGMGREVPDYYTIPYRLWVQTEEMEISVDADMTAAIHYKNGIPVPEPYHFDFDSTQEELTAVSEYLWETYGGMIGYKKPKLCINGGNYDIYGTQKYTLSFYEGSGDEREAFENYSFNRAEFTPNYIRIYSDKALDKVGLYPIIDEEDALQLLLDGRYYTSTMEEFPGKEAVVRSELIYRAGSKDKTLVPFYRFYVHLENAPGADQNPEGMETYGAYYVVAVDPSYLEK